MIEGSPVSERLLNRELSWLDFNARVLALADDERVPLLERVKFSAIFSSNLDEFFQVRVAALKDQVAAGITRPSPDGRTPAQQLIEISDRVEVLVREQERVLPRAAGPRPAATSVSSSSRGTSSTRTTASTWRRSSSSASSRC